MIQMTRQQYQQKYGTTPSQPSSQPTSQPVQMTRSQYQAKYGASPTPQPEKTPTGIDYWKGAAGNIGKSASGIVSGFGQMIAHPITTAKNLYNVGAGAVSKFIPGRQKSEDSFDQAKDFYKQRYGGAENIKNTFYNDPLGVVMDVATVASGAGGALRGAGAISKVSGLTKAGSALSKVGTAIDPLMATSKAVGTVTRPLFSKIKPAMMAKSEKMLTAGLGNPARQARIADKAGRSVASFIDEYKLYDRNPSTAREVTRQIGSQFDEAAMGSKAKIPVQRIIDSIDSKIAELKSGTGGVISDNTASQIDELTRRKNMFIESVIPKEPSILKPIDVPSKPLSVEPTADKALKKMNDAFKEVNDQAAKTGTVDPKKWREANKLADEYWKSKPLSVEPTGGKDSTAQARNQGGIGDINDVKSRLLNVFTFSESEKLAIRKAQTPEELAPYLRKLNDGSLAKFFNSGAGTVEHPNQPKPLSVEPVGGDPLATDMNNFMDANTPILKPKPDVLPEMQAEMSRNLNPRERVITPGEATTFRRKVIDPDVPRSEFGLNPKDTGKAGGVKATRDIFRQEIINAVPELKKLGLDYGMAKEVEKIITDAASRASNRQLFNFTKLGSAGVGAFLGGIPGLVGGFITEQLVNSPKFIEITSKMLRSIAQSKGTSPLFSKAGKSAYLFGKTGRMATAGQTETPKLTKVERSNPLPVTSPPIIQPPTTPYQVPKIRRPK